MRGVFSLTMEEMETVEWGRVFFLLQPRVETPFPEGLHDVQRVMMVLHPSESVGLRRILLTHKRLPHVRGRRERFWCMVDRVGTLDRVLDDLQPRTYETSTRGMRFQPGAMLVGAGDYAIARHGDHTHFSYALDPPARPNVIHDALGIQTSARYLLLAMRPFIGGRGLWQWRLMPDAIKEAFGDKRFADLQMPMLEHEGMNLVLVGAGAADRFELAEVQQSHASGHPGDPVEEALRATLSSWRPRVEETEPMLPGD